MNFIKLQIGCLFITLYILIVYVKKTIGKQGMSCNPIFDVIIAVYPWTIFFDGATAWTVNHLDTVPPALNLVLHCLFYIFIDSSIFLSFLYMLNITQGIPKRKIYRFLISLPFIISIVVILVFIKQTYYIHGKITNYSMGISAIACYVSVILHYGTLLVLVFACKNYIEIEKKKSIWIFLIITFIIMIVQMLKPEVLWTSIVPTMLVAGIYITIEDPYRRTVLKYNEEMVLGFANLVENRDNSTGGHIKRTKEYVAIIIEEMLNSKKYNRELTLDYRHNLLNAAPMHDIGKISTPDQILQKPGKLTAEEFEIMKKHAENGGKIIKETFAKLNKPEYLQIAYDVARYHHEKWNGKGYPEGRREYEIPLCARVMAIADVFDAVSAKRCYRDALPLDQCFEIIEKGRGEDFDPDLVDLFLNARDKITKLYNLEREI